MKEAKTAPRKAVAGKRSAVRQRLIEAAERLFAEHGIGVGIRTIAAEAQVNQDAVNYYFGDKDKLLAEIFRLRAEPIVAQRLRSLQALAKSGAPKLEDLLEAFLRPALIVGSGSGQDGRVFVKLRARLATENTPLSRKIVTDAFNESSTQYLKAIVEALPQIPTKNVYWGFHFLMGAMVFTMINPGRIQSMTDGECDPSDIDEAMQQLVPFLVAGMTASIGAPQHPGKGESTKPAAPVEALHEKIAMLERKIGQLTMEVDRLRV